MFDESIDLFELSGWRPRRLCCDYMAGCCAGGWGCTFAHGEQELHPSSLPGAPVLLITDELLNEADVAVKGSGEEAGGGGGRGAVVLQKQLLGMAGGTPIQR